MIRGEKKTISKMSETLQADIHNRFDIEVIDSKTGRVKNRAYALNTICSGLWTCLAADGGTYFNYIHYGSGSGTPSATDSALFNFLGSKAASTSLAVSMDIENGVASLTRSIQLSETEAIGSTLTEVGIAHSSKSSALVTHAVLKDMNGNPISLVKTDTDIINIYATVYIHWPVAYNSIDSPIWFIPNIYTKTTAGTAGRGFLYWLFGVSGGRHAYASLTSNNYAKPGEGNMGALTSTTTFDAATKRITWTFSRAGVSNFNFDGGCLGVLLYASWSSNVPYAPFLYLQSGADLFGGSNIRGEAIGTGDGETTDFATAFDLPHNATIYVDGVVETNVVVDAVPIRYTELQTYFNQVQVINGKAYPGGTQRTGYSGGYGDEAHSWIGEGVYENPFYELGISSIATKYGNAGTLRVSDDLTTWYDISKAAGASVSIPEEHQHRRYWDLVTGAGWPAVNAYSPALTGKNIHFSSPPALGAVITADYYTPVIAKDVNHVFDMTVTIQLGEYTEAQ